ncbi:Uncharacterised protein [Legionella steigerwaltii]|uniref:Uncharacterized protein n=1 Tax=Legionella steigerwaltii TaxID=460 RepID=A0A378L7H8_9GAMM|nr:Uncharacterised protein [Legionella steigerwaltii]
MVSALSDGNKFYADFMYRIRASTAVEIANG